MLADLSELHKLIAETLDTRIFPEKSNGKKEGEKERE